jgi:putative SOS response-associated peptidase YedK
MCGKFTAKASWTEIVDLAWQDAPEDDRILTYRVMGAVPLIVQSGNARRIVAMRWGFPHPKDWRRPQPIHARGETIDQLPAFAQAFRDGQRGIVLVESFNEAPESGEQHTVMPAGPIGIAFLWRQFRVAETPDPFFACVMVTVPANQLLTGLPTDRMPAVLAQEDWDAWLNGSPEAAQACLKTVEDVRWTMSREARAKTSKRGKPTISDPLGLF